MPTCHVVMPRVVRFINTPRTRPCLAHYAIKDEFQFNDKTICIYYQRRARVNLHKEMRYDLLCVVVMVMIFLSHGFPNPYKDRVSIVETYLVISQRFYSISVLNTTHMCL